jgi:hypothetical protein
MTNKKNKKYTITQKTIPTETTVTFKELTEENQKTNSAS